MVELLKVTGRMENCIGWYHSHPSYGCWLSSGIIIILIKYSRYKYTIILWTIK